MFVHLSTSEPPRIHGKTCVSSGLVCDCYVVPRGGFDHESDVRSSMRSGGGLFFCLTGTRALDREWAPDSNLGATNGPWDLHKGGAEASWTPSARASAR